MVKKPARQNSETLSFLHRCLFLRRLLISLLPLLPIMFSFPQYVDANEITLGWNPNIEDDLDGYRVHYGGSSRSYDQTLDLGNRTSCTLTGLQEGQTYYAAATAYDLAGNESGFSKEVQFTVAKSDTDGDGLADLDEVNAYGSSPTNADTDGDGLFDGEELAFWGNRWDTDLDWDGSINLLDPDADDDGFFDGQEIDAGSDPADGGSLPHVPPLVVGEMELDHRWTRVEFIEAFSDPVVVAKPLSLNGEDPAVIRIRNLDETGFEIRIQKWGYLGGSHTIETLSYLVMESGSYTLLDGTRLEAYRFNTEQTGFGPVTFTQDFEVVPVVITAISTFNNAHAITGRTRNITTRGFEFRSQEQELNYQASLTETVSYIAWEPSSGVLGGLAFEVSNTSNSVRHIFHTIEFTQFFAEPPFFLADMQTTDGGNTATLRWRSMTQARVEVQIDEEQSKDFEVRHTTEVVGYMAFAR